MPYGTMRPRAVQATSDRTPFSFSCHRRLLPAIAVLFGVLLCSAAPTRAANFFWTGSSPGGATWTTTTGGTNWSIDPNVHTDPGSFPTSADDVFFVFSPESQAFNTLGQDFSIKGLTFNAGAVTPVTVDGGGVNTLTIGTDGLTVNSGSASNIISANVAIGGVETWANNAVSATTLTVSGQISGSAALTLRGTGRPAPPADRLFSPVTIPTAAH